MLNENHSSNPNTSIDAVTPEVAGHRTRRQADGPKKGLRKSHVITAGAVAAIGAMVGTGFVVQGAVAAQGDRVAETRLLTESTDLNVDQLGSHGGILEARAVKQAQDTLAGANDTIAAAQGKADASQLASSVAALSQYRLLAPERVFALADTTSYQVHAVSAAVAEADRVAAEAAAKAAAEAAAAQAAAEAAAAQAASQRSSSSSSSSRPAGPANPSEAQAIALDMLNQRGWGDQFGCLVELWNRESGWNVYASNPSGAYGIPQALPGSKMSTAGSDWESNPATQITWGLGYIAGRYGDPCGAWDAFNAQGWY